MYNALFVLAILEIISFSLASGLTPEEDHKYDQRAGVPLLRGQATKVGAL